jgi:segregation and condensation protein B
MPESATLSERLCGLLFLEGAPLPYKKLAQQLGCDLKDIQTAFDILSNKLQGTGLQLVRTETEAGLALSPQAQTSAEQVRLKEMGKEIGDAGLEVLAIVLYKGESTRAQIDYIRGVNTASTVRLLLSRGLLERTGNPSDGREYFYRPTAQLLAHLGITDRKTLPDYATISQELAAFAGSQGKTEDTTFGPDNAAS